MCLDSDLLTLSCVFSSVVSGIKDTGFSSRGLSLSMLCLVTKWQGEEDVSTGREVALQHTASVLLGLGFFFFLVTPNFMFQRGNSFTKFLKCYRTNRVLSQGKFKTHQRIRYKMRASFLQDKTPSDDILGFRATGS